MTNPGLTIIKSDLPEKWQQILSDLITDPKELLHILELDPARQAHGRAALDQFPLKAPRPYVNRIEKGNWNDPLLRQIWPSLLEEKETPGYVTDPLAEQQFNPVPGLLHKYHGRVLLTTVPHCAIHCRYCFRRHFDYQENSPSRAEWQAALNYIADDPSIEEVIFSGGDPLAASDHQLAWLTENISHIGHVKILRIHTRLPIVIPQRVTRGLLDSLLGTRLKLVMVLHCNHAQELATDVTQALSTLAANGVMMLNQSVILKGVNDNSKSLVDLSKALFWHNVLPYYLHLPDRVAGTSHFNVEESHAKALLQSMQSLLPGYLVPHLVREQPGEMAKIRLG